MRILLTLIITLLLTACASTPTLNQGITNFQQQNYTDAFNQLTFYANKGDANAEYAVGYMYYYGKGVIEDRKLAIYWIRCAAKQGQPDSIQALQAIAAAGQLHTAPEDENDVPSVTKPLNAYDLHDASDTF